MSNPAAVSAADLAVISSARSTSNDAEAAYVAAAAAATVTEQATINVGLIKNKVLKLRTFEMLLQIQLAQGSRDQKAGMAQLAEVQDKLTKNIAIDVGNKGKASVSEVFTADD